MLSEDCYKEFKAFAKSQYLNIEKAECACCAFGDKHTELAWVLWNTIWKTLHVKD